MSAAKKRKGQRTPLARLAWMARPRREACGLRGSSCRHAERVRRPPDFLGPRNSLSGSGLPHSPETGRDRPGAAMG
jgi:hypothetical protein